MNNVLFIKTGLRQKAWLEYILSEFAAIHCFQGQITVLGLAEAVPDGADVISYGREFTGGVSVVDRSDALPSKNVDWIEAGLYVMPGTRTADTRFSLAYDLFWNAFVFLSGLEEQLLFQQGRVVLSHCVLHPRRDKSSFLIPVVNVLFDRLEALIRKEFSHFVFAASPSPIIDLSHDVDYLSKSPVFMIKQSILNVYDLLCSASRPHECFFSLKRAIRFLGTHPSFWCFDDWAEFEKSMGVRSVFYIHAKVRRGPETWLIDPDYDLAGHKRLQGQLRRLAADGFSIGLHGSFFSAADEGLMTREKKILEDVLGQTVTRTRQHWLRFVHATTPYAHERLFAIDSTLGWNDLVGYRNGCASAFHPYDHAGQRAFRHLEIPQVIMDFNIFQSLGLENSVYIQHAAVMLEHFYKCKSGRVSVSWHQQTCSSDYDWQGRYQQIVQQYADKRKAG
ncbi:MAG: hypothetical protein HQL17_08245 [Candidatus Omnitrophica bacterium]|nr:hypothetical protein [Candidatus Omnitrophota bacterium]